MASYLLIDDDMIFNTLSSKVICMLDAEAKIEKFLSSMDALQHLLSLIENKKELPEYMLIDINMPAFTGFELLDKILEKHPSALDNCNCYILTSSLDQRDENHAKDYSFIKGFLEKPLRKEIMQKALSKSGK